MGGRDLAPQRISISIGKLKDGLAEFEKEGFTRNIHTRSNLHHVNLRVWDCLTRLSEVSDLIQSFSGSWKGHAYDSLLVQYCTTP